MARPPLLPHAPHHERGGRVQRARAEAAWELGHIRQQVIAQPRHWRRGRGWERPRLDSLRRHVVGWGRVMKAGTALRPSHRREGVHHGSQDRDC